MVGQVLVSVGENNILCGQLQMCTLLHEIKEVMHELKPSPGGDLGSTVDMLSNASMLSNPGIKYHSRRTSSPTCGGLQSIAFLCIFAQNLFEVAAGGGEM